MKTVQPDNIPAGSTVGGYTFVATPPPKLCRHRQRSSSGRCLDCNMHRDPMTVSPLGADLLPSAALAVQI